MGAPLGQADIYDIVRQAVLAPETASDRFGIEAEWFPLHQRHLGRASIAETAQLIREGGVLEERPGDNPSFVNSSGGTVTFEPGGQIEHSGIAHATVPGAFGELADTHQVLTSALGKADIMLVPAGVDHWNDVGKIDQQLVGPRYPAMAAFFDARDTTGRLMMRHTASLQINLDAGNETLPERWVLANRLSPLLTASFSTSPADGTHSLRAMIWRRLDDTRTGFPYVLDPDVDVVEILTRRALEADVVVVVRPDGAVEGHPGWRLVDWLEKAHPTGGQITRDDVAYHLTTLFPEVRLRGGVLELRAIDGLPARWCVIPAVLMGGALYDETTRDALLDITEPFDPHVAWATAASKGFGSAALLDLAHRVWPLALEGAARLGRGVTGDLSAIHDFVDRRLGARSTFAHDIRTRLAGDPDRTAFWLAGH